jgi:hypothetical protein
MRSVPGLRSSDSISSASIGRLAAVASAYDARSDEDLERPLVGARPVGDEVARGVHVRSRVSAELQRDTLATSPRSIDWASAMSTPGLPS